MSTPKAHNHNAVFILGAGASVDAGMPVVADFLERMRDSVEWLEDNKRERELRAVEAVLDFRLKSAAAAYRARIDVENIEELFSFAAATGTRATQDVNLAIAATLEFCRDQAPKKRVELDVSKDREWEPPQRWTVEPNPLRGQVERSLVGTVRLPVPEVIYAYLSGRAFKPDPRRRVTIITFNYDLVAETALDALGVRRHYGPAESHDEAGPDRDAIELLKLHGSVNWAHPRSEDGERNPLAGRIVRHESYEQLMDAGDVPLIVPPTWQKQFVQPLDRVWEAAVSAIREATRIFILGFSIPATDTHFKYLLAAGLADNISLRKLVLSTRNKTEPEARLRQILRDDLLQRVVEAESYDIAPFAVGILPGHLGLALDALPVTTHEWQRDLPVTSPWPTR